MHVGHGDFFLKVSSQSEYGMVACMLGHADMH